jgi:hypothetical protein
VKRLRLLSVPVVLCALAWLPAASGAIRSAQTLHAALEVLPTPVLTGDTVYLDASGSRDSGGLSIVDYKWDLGSGTFTVDTKSLPDVHTKFSTVGQKTVRVQVTDEKGHTAVAAGTVEVRLAPPKGEIGIVIDGGAYGTSSRAVTLSVVWPVFALNVQISNSRSFASAKKLPLGKPVHWQLPPAGGNGKVLTVYARFPGSSDPKLSYRDIIVWDTKVPVIHSASSTKGFGGARGVLLKATEPVSGISLAQVSTTRSGGKTVSLAKPGERGVLSVSQTVSVKMSAKPQWVRVCSAAGRWSPWHRIA